MDQILFSSKSDDWKTPKLIYNELVYKYGFEDLFPFKATNNQLNIDAKTYTGKKVFINPPYSKLTDRVYLDYILSVLSYCDVGIVLVPSRTDTRWFQCIISVFNASLYFFTGRLKFNDCSYSAPFPSCAIIITKLKNTAFNHLWFNGDTTAFVDLFLPSLLN